MEDVTITNTHVQNLVKVSECGRKLRDLFGEDIANTLEKELKDDVSAWTTICLELVAITDNIVFHGLLKQILTLLMDKIDIHSYLPSVLTSKSFKKKYECLVTPNNLLEKREAHYLIKAHLIEQLVLALGSHIETNLLKKFSCINKEALVKQLPAIVAYFIKKDIEENFSCTVKDIFSPKGRFGLLAYYVVLGFVEGAFYLIKQGADANARVFRYINSLCLSVQTSDLAMTEMLLNNGADPDGDILGRDANEKHTITPLNLAILDKDYSNTVLCKQATIENNKKMVHLLVSKARFHVFFPYETIVAIEQYMEGEFNTVCEKMGQGTRLRIKASQQYNALICDNNKNNISAWQEIVSLVNQISPENRVDQDYRDLASCYLNIVDFHQRNFYTLKENSTLLVWRDTIRQAVTALNKIQNKNELDYDNIIDCHKRIGATCNIEAEIADEAAKKTFEQKNSSGYQQQEMHPNQAHAASWHKPTIVGNMGNKRVFNEASSAFFAYPSKNTGDASGQSKKMRLNAKVVKPVIENDVNISHERKLQEEIDAFINSSTNLLQTNLLNQQ